MARSSSPEAPPKRRDVILSDAARLFYERGFHAVGMSDIGAASGISGPALYKHFKGKDDILATLIGEGIEEVIAGARSHTEDPREQIRHLVISHVTHQLEKPELMGTWAREETSLSPEARTALAPRMRRYFDHWVGSIQAAYPQRSKAEAETAAHAALGLINSIGRWPPKQLKNPRLPEQVADLVLEGLGSLGRRAT